MMCCVDGCDREIGKHGAKQMCPRHYKRSRAGQCLTAPIGPRQQAAGLTCSMEDCEGSVRARGLCATHHARWLKHGDPTVVRHKWDTTSTKVERIWEFVNKDGLVPTAPWCPVEGNCWLWTGYIDRNGYGWLSGIPAHRRIYELTIGSPPADLDLDHLCRVPACVRPDHLEPVTRAENARRQGAGKDSLPSWPSLRRAQHVYRADKR